MYFQVSGVFSESGGKICRIEVRHFFRPKEDPGMGRMFAAWLSTLLGFA